MSVEWILLLGVWTWKHSLHMPSAFPMEFNALLAQAPAPPNSFMLSLACTSLIFQHMPVLGQMTWRWYRLA